MDNERGIEETWSDWDGSNRNVAVGTILASALVAGVIAYVIRRRRESEEQTLVGASAGPPRLRWRRSAMTASPIPASY